MHVPQLEALLREAQPLPGFVAALVGRRAPRRLHRQSPQAELLTGRPLPVAALTRRLDRPGDAAGAWLRADPIGLVPDLAAVWLEPETEFGAGEWSEEIAALFAEEGMEFELAESGRGYLRLERVPDCEFSPPWTLAGESLERLMPRGTDARAWRRLLNETQVLLHQHRQRSRQPRSVPGSLWFWGGGALPERAAVDSRVERIVADTPVLSGLADWLDIPRESPVDAGADALGPGTLFEWRADERESAIDNLERLQALLRPAWRGLRSGRLRLIELAGMTTTRRFGPLDAWRVWR